MNRRSLLCFMGLGPIAAPAALAAASNYEPSAALIGGIATSVPTTRVSGRGARLTMHGVSGEIAAAAGSFRCWSECNPDGSRRVVLEVNGDIVQSVELRR